MSGKEATLMGRIKRHLPRGLVPWALLTVVAVLLDWALGRALFETDVIAAVLRLRPAPLLAAAILYFLRLYLYFLAPAWALHLAVRTALERRMAGRRASEDPLR